MAGTLAEGLDAGRREDRHGGTDAGVPGTLPVLAFGGGRAAHSVVVNEGEVQGVETAIEADGADRHGHRNRHDPLPLGVYHHVLR